MSDISLHCGSVAACLGLTMLVAYPLLMHVWVGWRRKADDITKGVTDGTKKAYLVSFQGMDESNINDPSAEYWVFYKKWYGRRYYIVPVTLIIVTAICETYLLAETGLYYFYDLNKIAGRANVYYKLPDIAAAALSGAYMFVAWDIISQATRRDLFPASIMSSALRLGIAIPIGYAFSAIIAAGVGPFIAFAVGAFPVETLATILRRIANKKLDLEVGADTAPDQVVQLSGVDKPTADRIERADITTISQLAYCDPIQLSMRTNLDLDYIVDIVSQALAWTYLRDYVDALRPLGYRGAWEIRDLWLDLNSSDPAVSAKAQTLIKQISAAMSTASGSINATALANKKPAIAPPITPESLMFVFQEISEDENTKFLHQYARR